MSQSKHHQKRARPPLGEGGGGQVIWFQLDRADYVELRNRQAATGASVQAQIRIFIRDALHAKKRVLK